MQRLGIILALGTLLLSGCFIPATTPTAVPTLTEAACPQEQIDAAVTATGEYTPSATADFARIENGQMMVGDAPYPIHGINYYPARYPWRRFLTETDDATLHTEFAVLRDANINTLRIFVWQYALFICPGSDAVPHAPHMQRLDKIMQLRRNMVSA